jgi:hypothetical protein
MMFISNRNANLVLLIVAVILINFWTVRVYMRYDGSRVESENARTRGNVFYESVRNAWLIFIGGSQRSGTTLMRALMDVHDSIRCGTEVNFFKMKNSYSEIN